jgi:Fe-S-cluster containining protein
MFSGVRMSEVRRAIVKFGLKVAGRELEASARVPAGPCRIVDVLPALHGIADMIVAVGEDQAREAGKTISCRAGCGACCRQLVPVSEMDALFLAEHVACSPEPRRSHVRARFAAALATLEAAGLLDRIRRIDEFPPGERLEAAVQYFRAGVACPFLEEESCSIYPLRPMSCREYLVTNPAENCRDPRADAIQMVDLPLKPSVVLYHFGDAKGEDKLRYVTLILALEWAAGHAGDPRPELPGAEIVLSFLRRLSGMPRDWQPPIEPH